MGSNVQMVFRGEVLDGFQADEVRRRLAQALKLDDHRVAQLFSGTRTVLKRSVEPNLARGYVDKLAQLGARVHLEPSDAPPTTGFAPLPELPELPAAHVPAPPPWAAPRQSSPPATAAPVPAPAPIPAANAALTLEPIDEVTCPNCGERQSKRLLCRQCTTDIPMAIAAREEARDQARAARVQAMPSLQNRRRALADEASAVGIFGLGFEGRMGRLKYATANAATMALFYMPLIMVLQRPTLGRLALLAIAGLALTFFGMRLAVLRCHDCDKSGWWSMLLWLPTVNFIVTVVLACAPGTEGSNEYGEPPPPSSWWGFAAASLCFVLLIALTFSHLVRAYERASESSADNDDAAMTFEYDPRAATLPNLQAQAGFNEAYLPAKGHKAFAVSPAGAWGWTGGRSSQGDAVRGALQECEGRRPAYTAQCALVNLDGLWASPR